MSSNTRTYTTDADTALIMLAVPKGLRSRFIRDAVKRMDLDAWVVGLVKENTE